MEQQEKGGYRGGINREKNSLRFPELFQGNVKNTAQLNQILRTLAAAGPLGPSVISN